MAEGGREGWNNGGRKNLLAGDAACSDFLRAYADHIVRGSFAVKGKSLVYG